MYISSVRVNNYKSFNQSPILELKRGFNIIVGKNNAGKTALLEALSLQFSQKPHRSIKTAPKVNSHINPTSSVDIAFTLDRSELIEILHRLNTSFCIPIPSDIALGNSLEIGDHNRDPIISYANQVMSKTVITFNLQLQREGGWVIPKFPSYEELDVHGGQGKRYFAQCNFKDDRVQVEERILNGGEGNEIGYRVVGFLSPQIYCFRAERMLIARCAVGADRMLYDTPRNSDQ